MGGIYQWPVDTPHKWSVMQKEVPCRDVILVTRIVKIPMVDVIFLITANTLLYSGHTWMVGQLIFF